MQKLRGLFWMLLAFIPCLVLILPLIWWIPAFIRKFIHLSNTTFFLSSDELTMEYRFLDISRITFTLDRITGISISESIMDRMFGTYTLVVWSLGAQEEMRIPYIKEDELRKTLLEQINVVPVSGMKRIDSAFSLMSYLTRHLYLSCFIISLVFSFIFISVVMTNAITIAGTFIVLFCAALHFAFSATYYDGAHITYNNRKLFVEKGNAIYHLRQYAFFSQVKGLTMIAYPFSDKATLHIDIAGEHMITSGTNNLQLASNSFTMPYMDERITLIKTDDTPLQSYGVHLPIVLVRMFLAFPIFPIVIAYLRSIRYIITKTHVETQSGIIYRKRQFILYTSIDHIQYGQGALQKAFKVGTVSVYTTGSSGSEMDLRDFSAYQTLHKKLITLYGRR